ETPRAAMDADDDIALADPEHRRRRGIGDQGNLLHFEVVIARPERAHLALLALACPRRYVRRHCASHAAALLDAFQIRGIPEALFHRPCRAACQHAVHSGLVELDATRAAESGG